MNQTANAHTGSILFKLPAALLLLLLLTALLHFGVQRFEPDGPPIIAAGDFSGWTKKSDYVSFIDKGATVRILREKTGPGATLYRYVKVLPSHTYLRLAGDMTTTNVRLVNAKRGGAVFSVTQRLANGEQIRNFPRKVIENLGTTPWRHFERVFPIHPIAKQLSVELRLEMALGEARFRNVELQPMQERPLYTWLARTLYLLWGGLLVAAFLALRPFDIKKGALALIALAALAGSLFPGAAMVTVKEQAEKFFTPVATHTPIGGQLSTSPAPADTPPSEPVNWNVIHKGGHLVIYITLTLAALYAFRPQFSLGAILLLAAGFALATETLQIFSDGRKAHPLDILINETGVAIGGLLYYAVIRKNRNKES